MDARRLISCGLALALCACGSDDGSGDGGGDTDAGGVPAGPPTLPGTAGQWSWIDVPGTQCMNGSATGMGVNLGTSGDLVIFLEGGGACFNDFTCSSVAHPNGFNAADLNTVTRGLGGGGLFSRTEADNPLKDATYVFFPYCTGDIFAGSNENGFGGRKQVGYDNIGKYLETIVPASAPVQRVILSGASAGGFGALYNYSRVKEAFGQRPVFLIDDSGPPLPDMWLTPCLQTRLRQTWNLAETLPPTCSACTGADGGGLANALPFLAEKYPDERLALITSTRDGVIRTFFGFGYPSCNSSSPMPENAYAEAIRSVRTDLLAGTSNFKLFTIESGGHVWMLEALGTTMTGGKTLGAWLTAMLEGDAGWDHASP